MDLVVSYCRSQRFACFLRIHAERVIRVVFEFRSRRFGIVACRQFSLVVSCCLCGVFYVAEVIEFLCVCDLFGKRLRREATLMTSIFALALTEAAVHV